MKLNTDRASHGNPGSMTAGGVMRNGDGEWCGGFSLNRGICSVALASSGESILWPCDCMGEKY